MGWTSKNCNYDHQDFNLQRAAEFLYSEFDDSRLKTVKAHLQIDGDEHRIYGVFQNTHIGKCFIMVIIIHITENEIYWKEITESMQPFYFDCPLVLFDICKSDNERADHWRLECIEHGSNPKLNEIPLIN